MAGTGTIMADATVKRSTIYPITASISDEAGLTATGTVTYSGFWLTSGTIAGTGAITANASSIPRRAFATLAGTGLLIATARARLPGRAMLAGTGGATVGSWTMPVTPLGLYELAGVVPAAVGSSPFDIKVIEATSDGAGTFWTQADVAAMKGDRGIVMGYLDCGWCENYRPYYATAQAAGILGPADDPDWPEEYKVQFWSSTWLTICLNWCDSVIAAGFDGIYLDVIDAWNDRWCKNHVPGVGATNSANAMIALITAIRNHGRERNPNFKLWVNGGEELFAYSPPSFLNAIDGMFKEQVCYGNNSPGQFSKNSYADRNYEYDILSTATNAGKPVVLIEYVSGRTAINDVKTTCADWGFGYYIANPNLNLSGIDLDGV